MDFGHGSHMLLRLVLDLNLIYAKEQYFWRRRGTECANLCLDDVQNGRTR